ncbi:putative zinc-binding metallopeptidase [Comamonas aquatilis]|uniref:zinc-binding metallopeptidase family protein n=1 Tax=Comamonas aquatilis TaxID=1778406 RepID=UPI0039EE0D63
MQVFNCDACGHLVFFDSLQCLHCGAQLAFLPDQLRVAAVQPLHYRLCAHRHNLNLCNFAIETHDAHTLCVSCRQTEWLPDSSNPANELRWAKIEMAKRRLYYTLAKLGLMDDDWQPRFSLLADMPGAPPVMTGHYSGMITLNVVEADDDERAKRRLALHEPYRTLIGHLRHECGHFYWEKLIANSPWLELYRALFGDERQDYGHALLSHYNKNPFDIGWQTAHVSAYATSHPWEDWAETWAHYLHMMDLLETAASYRMQMTVPEIPPSPTWQMRDPLALPTPSFDVVQAQWVPLTLIHNSLNHSLGHGDAYPFATSAGAWAKLRFVHEVLTQRRAQAPA